MTAPLAEVVALLDECNMGPLTIQRRPPKVQNDRGGFDTPPPVPVVVNPIVVHNVSGRDLSQVPEGDRNSEIIFSATKVPIRIADGGQGVDVLEYNGRTFRAVQVRDFGPAANVWCTFWALEDVQAEP